MKLPIVGVIGSGSESHEALAGPLGRWLASQPVHLLTGGGQGVMASVSRAFAEVQPRIGQVIGILPSASGSVGLRSGYPNAWVEIPIVTHLPLSGVDGMSEQSRNHLVVLTSRCLIALPGGAGTASEIALALRYGRPLLAYGADPRSFGALREQLTVTTDFAAVCAFVRQHIGE